MANIYYDNDANLDLLKGKTVAVIGYGSQGHAQALNLKESGVEVVIGELPDSKPRKLAQEAGFTVLDADEAAKRGDVIVMLVPDTVMKHVYAKQVAPHLETGNALVFSHGFNIRYGYIQPPENVAVFMVAPKGPGHLVRSVYQEGGGVPCLVAVENDPDGKTKDLALAYAKGIGGTRAGVIETTFTEETETDLLGEQAVLCGGVTCLIKAGFETLVEAGYQPEIAYFECMHELKLIVDLLYQGGLSYMWYSVSDTAEYGGLSRGSRVVGEQSKQAMKALLDDVKSGKFAAGWMEEHEQGRKEFEELRKAESEHPIEQVGKELRSMMSWLGPSKK